MNESGFEPRGLDNYRNAAAAEILGISSSRADTDGLALLHRLALVAPDPSSDVIFLPQNRAIRLMKACQEWVGSDEGVSEDVESLMTLVFQYLAPILQNVPGAHWDFVFDVIENNLEVRDDFSSVLPGSSKVFTSTELFLLGAINSRSSGTHIETCARHSRLM